MKAMTKNLNTKGAGLVEYGLLAGLISVVAIAAVLETGEEVEQTFTSSTNSLSTTMATSFGSGAGADVTPEVPTAAECYDPDNIYTVGQAGWTGCEGMLIVDKGTMQSAVNNDSYYIEYWGDSGPTNYTFTNDANNIFTGQVTDLDWMFSSKAFNGDINYWDVSNVTSMQGTFTSSSFDSDLSSWDVSNVTAMNSLFAYSPFNSDVSSWDTSSVQDMGYIFDNTPFSGDVSNWNVSSATDISGMFRGTPFNGDLSNWNTSSVTGMMGVFENTLFNGDISGWDTSSVTGMDFLFYNNTAFNQDLSGWNVSSEISNWQYDVGATAWEAAHKPTFP